MDAATIVLFERNKGVCFVLEKSLDKYEDWIQVISVHSGEQALKIIEERPFDLLISEISKTNSDGLQISARARQLWPDLRIIWVTVAGCRAFSREKNQLNIVSCLEKPLDIKDFRRVTLGALGYSEGIAEHAWGGS